MLFLTESILLHKCKKAQGKQDGAFVLDPEHLLLYRFNDQRKKSKAVSVKGYKHSISAYLNFLLQEGYLRKGRNATLSVTRKGWRRTAEVVYGVILWIISSCLVPAAAGLLSAWILFRFGLL